MVKGKEERGKVIIWERQIEEDAGGCAHIESAAMDCFILCCCEKVPLGPEIWD